MDEITNFRKLRVMIPEQTFQEIKKRGLLKQVDGLVTKLLEEYLKKDDYEGDGTNGRKQY